MVRNKRGSKASAISDRSGVRYPMNEMVIEPGTGWLVHRSESDGQWSLNKHPLNNVGKYLKGKQGDPYPVENARPRIGDEIASGVTSYNATANLATQYYIHPVALGNYVGDVIIGGVATLAASGEISTLLGTATLVGVATLTATAGDWLAADWDTEDWDSV